MNRNEILTSTLAKIYDLLPYEISNLNIDLEGTEYDACQFELDRKQVICRRSKITPKKLGQFVTFWKRDKKGITAPFHGIRPFRLLRDKCKNRDSFRSVCFP